MSSLLDRIKARLQRFAVGEPQPNNTVGTTNLSVREAWLEKTLASIPAGHRMLDAGAGELQYKRFCTHLDYVSQDFGQYDGQGNQVGLQTKTWDNSRLDIVSDIASIPEPDASFDAIMCIEVFEHIPHPMDAIRELDRLLKPGGVMIITAPFCSMTHFAPYFFHTGYSRYFYEHYFDELGYEIEDMQWNGNYFEYIAQELRRLPQMAEQYGGQPLDYQHMLSVHHLINTLDTLSKHDKGSEQLLAFGLHVKACKRQKP